MIEKRTTALLLFFLSIRLLPAQDIKNIQLKNEKIALPLKNYHIIFVKDERSDTSNIGSVKIGMLSKKKTAVNLENGVAKEIGRFIKNNVTQDTATTPIELHITKLGIEETGSSGLKTENDLTTGFAFYLGAQKLTENSGGGTTQSTGDPSKLIDELIRGNIETTLHQFDEWWANNRSFYEAQNKKPSIKVEVSMEDDPQDPDLISYSPKRPLKLDDFQGKPDNMSKAAAITYSVVYMKYSSARNISNEIIVDVFVIANFDKTKSWCRNESRNTETLEHEQRHFDISAIKACELIDTIKKFQFSVDNFPRELQRLQRQKQKELDELQDQYDSESKHGTGQATQEKWNRLVRDQLQNLNCFHS